jgi:hypothetical protein
VGEEQVLAVRLTNSAGRSFVCIPKQIRTAAFLFADTKGVNHPWDKDKIFASKDWFLGSLKRNNIALRETECFECKSTVESKGNCRFFF